LEAGHLKRSRNAPGGQLVQAIDRYVGVQNARIVLCDDTEVRAIMTASWIKQMGWKDVYILQDGVGEADLIRGTHSPEILGPGRGPSIAPGELKKALDSDSQVAVVDLAGGPRHWRGHIPGSWWGVRSRLGMDVSNLPAIESLILASPDGTVAHLAYQDLKDDFGSAALRVLEGGTNAWIQEGHPLDEGMQKAISPTDESWSAPDSSNEGTRKLMQAYLEWETGLLGQIERDGDHRFQSFM